MKKTAYKAIIKVIYYESEEQKNLTEIIIIWAKNEIEVGKLLKDRYKDTVVSYEVKWLSDGVLLLPDDTDVVDKIINENSY